MPQKKTPLRQCLGCRQMKPKKELLRVVRSPEGGVALDPKGKAPGRGAYVCNDAQCLKKAIKSSALSRALEISVPEEVYDALKEQMESSYE